MAHTWYCLRHVSCQWHYDSSEAEGGPLSLLQMGGESSEGIWLTLCAVSNVLAPRALVYGPVHGGWHRFVMPKFWQKNLPKLYHTCLGSSLSLMGHSSDYAWSYFLGVLLFQGLQDSKASAAASQSACFVFVFVFVLFFCFCRGSMGAL